VQAHRLQWLTELDAFLGKHLRLPGDAAAGPPVSALPPRAGRRGVPGTPGAARTRRRRPA
jgi:hypothetical protein